MKYLAYDSASDVIGVADAKPQGYIGLTHQDLMGRLVSVWHPILVQPDAVVLAIRVMLVQMQKFPFGEINSAVTQIVSRYLPNQYSLIPPGEQAPKIIKWILKRKGYNTVAITVSKITSKAAPTVAFVEYVKRKLDKITNNNIVVMDFVESGESLIVVKSLLAEHWKRGVVAAVALGTGTKFKPDGVYAPQIDYIVENIPQLTQGFEMNTYKQLLGRSKDMLNYATFPGLVKDGNVLGLHQRQFANQKSAFARAAELGPIQIDLLEFLEIAETESSDAEDDVASGEGKL